MRRVPDSSEKPLHWVGSAKRDFMAVRTAIRDVALVTQRLKAAARDHEEHYGKPKRRTP